MVAGGAAGVWVLHNYGRDLPDYRQLADYAPPTVTRIHAGDGRLLAEYARERRVFVPIEAIPDRVKQAFIAAEDQNFYRHPGIDPVGHRARRAGQHASACGTIAGRKGRRRSPSRWPRTSCVGNELSIDRKIKEAILALRMERAFTQGPHP